jgi:cadmium resistance protein CadD (predicted permease)
VAASIISGLGILPLFFGMTFKPTFGVSAKDSREKTSLSSLLDNPAMRIAMYASLTVSSTVDVLVVFLPVFGRDKGFSSGAIGIILALRATASMLSRVNLGRLTKIIGYYRLLAGSRHNFLGQ